MAFRKRRTHQFGHVVDDQRVDLLLAHARQQSVEVLPQLVHRLGVEERKEEPKVKCCVYVFYGTVDRVQTEFASTKAPHGTHPRNRFNRAREKKEKRWRARG